MTDADRVIQLMITVKPPVGCGLYVGRVLRGIVDRRGDCWVLDDDGLKVRLRSWEYRELHPENS